MLSVVAGLLALTSRSAPARGFHRPSGITMTYERASGAPVACASPLPDTWTCHLMPFELHRAKPMLQTLTR